MHDDMLSGWGSAGRDGTELTFRSRDWLQRKGGWGMLGSNARGSVWWVTRFPFYVGSVSSWKVPVRL